MLKQRLAQDDKRISLLKEEITKSKQHKVKLQQQMKAKAEGYAQWMKENDKKIKVLRKAARKNQIQMGKMQRQMKNQAMVQERSQKKIDELSKKLEKEKDKNAKQHKTMVSVLQKRKDRKPGAFRPKMSKDMSKPGLAKAASAPTTSYLSKVPSHNITSRGSHSSSALPTFSHSASSSSFDLPAPPSSLHSTSKPKPNTATASSQLARPGSNGRPVLGNKNPNTSGHGLVRKRDNDKPHSLIKKAKVVPAKAPEPKVPSSVDMSSSIKSIELDILKMLNTASAKELGKLDMIGPKRAQLILAKREEEQFEAIRDLNRIGFSENNIQTFLQRNMMSRLMDGTTLQLSSA